MFSATEQLHDIVVPEEENINEMYRTIETKLKRYVLPVSKFLFQLNIYPSADLGI
jgi:hypothetical protein